jgi:cob(I)alamin adenosyltransferase
MVKLNVIYTKTGDKGETGLGDGSRRVKSDRRVAAIGDVDETNCAIGLALIAVSDWNDAADVAIEPTLKRIQNDLFDLGADLCLPPQADEKPGAALRIASSQVEALERAIDALNARLHPLRSFVLPGGGAAAAALHQARAVCRRAERAMVALASIEGEEVGEAALAYVNRLSDYLFVAARAANDFGRADVLWAPGANQSENE